MSYQQIKRQLAVSVSNSTENLRQQPAGKLMTVKQRWTTVLCCCKHFWESRALKFCFIDCVRYYCLWHHLVLWIEKRSPHLAKQQLPLEVCFFCKMACLPQGILNNLRLLLCYDTRTSIKDDNFHRTDLRVDAFSTNCSGFFFYGTWHV